MLRSARKSGGVVAMVSRGRSKSRDRSRSKGRSVSRGKKSDSVPLSLFLDDELFLKAQSFLTGHARVQRAAVLVVDESSFELEKKGVRALPAALDKRSLLLPQDELRDCKLSDEILRTARGLFSSTKSYRFRLHTAANISSDSSGNLKGAVSCDPATSSFSEWSTLILLFDEAKMVGTKFDWVAFMSSSGVNEAANATTSTTPHYSAGSAVAFGFRPDQIVTTPSSIVNVYRLPMYRLFNIYQPHVKASVKRLPSRSWSEVTTPSPLHPIGGCAGCWEYMSGNTVNNSVQYATVFLQIDVIFRARI